MKSRIDCAVALACLALLGILGGGCSNAGGAGSTPPTGGTLSRDDYAQQLAEWLCDDLAACCSGAQRSLDRATCVKVKHAAELHRVASEEAHSKRVFDAAVAATCVAKLKETPASCEPERRVTECFQTFDGTREIGEECAGKFECRDSVRGDTACVAGRCVARLATGDSCQDLPQDNGRCDVCRPDARCRPTTDGAHQCVAYHQRGVAGDTCQGGPTTPVDPAAVLARCQADDGLYCSLAGVCAPFLPVGASCTLPLECGPGDARCVDGTCTAGLQAGATCTSSFYECGAGFYCLFDEGEELTAGHCTVPAAVGQACGARVPCAPDLVCQPASATGEEGFCVAAADSLCTTGLARLTRQSNANDASH